MSGDDDNYNYDSAYEDEDLTATRKQASGVVRQRPVYINIISKVEISSGVTVCGDAEGAMSDVYEDYIRPDIQDDLDTGILHAHSA